VLATYREPYVLRHRTDLSFLAYREDEERTAFSYDRVGIGLQTTRTLSAERSLVFRYALSRTRLTDLTVPLADVDREFQSSRTAGPSFSLFLDHRDDPLDPRRGQFLSGELQFSHAVLGGASFFKSFMQASEFKPVTPRLLLAVGTRVGLVWPLRGEDLAVPERFFAGGNYSMRGFVTDGVLPEGGQALLTGSVELRIGILGRLSFAAFSDIGNVYPTVSDLSLGDLRYTAGLGLRYRTPVGPLRVDWAHKLDRRSGEPAYRFHVTVGHAF
jgi:outer membrane protein insertion porin family